MNNVFAYNTTTIPFPVSVAQEKQSQFQVQSSNMNSATSCLDISPYPLSPTDRELEERVRFMNQYGCDWTNYVVDTVDKEIPRQVSVDNIQAHNLTEPSVNINNALCSDIVPMEEDNNDDLSIASNDHISPDIFSLAPCADESMAIARSSNAPVTFQDNRLWTSVVSWEQSDQSNASITSELYETEDDSTIETIETIEEIVPTCHEQKPPCPVVIISFEALQAINQRL